MAVLVVSAHDEPRIVRRVLDHGGAGSIPKSVSPAEIGETIRSVLDCGNWPPPGLADAASPPCPPPRR